MLAGSLQTRAPFDLTPPETTHASDAEVEPNLLFIAADGRMALGNTPVKVADLPARLGAWDTNEALPIKADAGLPVRKLTALLASLRAAGVTKVRLITLHHS